VLIQFNKAFLDAKSINGHIPCAQNMVTWAKTMVNAAKNMVTCAQNNLLLGDLADTGAPGAASKVGTPSCKMAASAGTQPRNDQKLYIP
jgi:hypothetical protein